VYARVFVDWVIGFGIELGLHLSSSSHVAIVLAEPKNAASLLWNFDVTFEILGLHPQKGPYAAPFSKSVASE
jgi:hypothetical protein